MHQASDVTGIESSLLCGFEFDSEVVWQEVGNCGIPFIVEVCVCVCTCVWCWLEFALSLINYELYW